MHTLKKKNTIIDNKESLIHSLKMKTTTEKIIKIIKIPYPKLLSWKPLGQQFGRVKGQQYLGLSLWDQKNFSSCPNLSPWPPSWLESFGTSKEA